MKAFALPSYYDGRIRLNVVGREARGLVEPNRYETVREQIADIISDCRNLQTGEKVVREIHAPKKNFNAVGPSEADLYVLWEGTPLGFMSPQFGKIGPVPYRRTGGHTGQHGFLSMVSGDLPAGHYGVASSFDVVPTLIHLLGDTKKTGISGRSLLPGAVDDSA
jgi:predicted AlkP superfamily phosphohydrolase/phosphomutase